MSIPELSKAQQLTASRVAIAVASRLAASPNRVTASKVAVSVASRLAASPNTLTPRAVASAVAVKIAASEATRRFSNPININAVASAVVSKLNLHQVKSVSSFSHSPLTGAIASAVNQGLHQAESRVGLSSSEKFISSVASAVQTAVLETASRFSNFQEEVIETHQESLKKDTTK